MARSARRWASGCNPVHQRRTVAPVLPALYGNEGRRQVRVRRGQVRCSRRLHTDRIPHRQTTARRHHMATKVVKLWFDREGDFLEVLFEDKEGFFRETENDQVMGRVDTEGNTIGFSVTNVSKLTVKPLQVAL